MIIAFLVDLIVNLYVFFLLLRMVVDEKEFFFSPFLQPIYRATEPLLGFLQNKVHFFDRHRSMSAFLLIAVLIIFRGVLLNFMSVNVLYNSRLSVSLSYVFKQSVDLSILLSIINCIDLLFQALVVILISLLLVSPYSTNAIIRFSQSLTRPLLEISKRIFAFAQRGMPFLALLLVIFVHFGLMFSLVSLYTATNPYLPTSDSGTYFTQFGFGTQPGPEKMMQGLMDPRHLFYNTIDLTIRAFGFFTIVIIIGALMSWFQPDPFNPLVQWVEAISFPILVPFRRFIPALGGIDLSPIFAILLIELCRDGLNNIFALILGLKG